VKCKICKSETYTETIPLCPKCAKADIALDFVSSIHSGTDKIGGKNGLRCSLCSNRCGIDEGESGLCGLKSVKDGKLSSLATSKKAILHAYEDPLPTNCCNAWFCNAKNYAGTNMAVFYYGCNFDCLFCQNWQHRIINDSNTTSIEEMLDRSMDERIKCVCHFGGSPEPQLPFAIKFSSELLKRREVMICWEWNGSSSKLALKVAELSYKSKGTVKFDLKAWNNNLHQILTGRSNEQTINNFREIWGKYPDVLSATTLLVPYFVEEGEVEKIASFISSLSDSISYSLLVFHPDFRLSDMPVTPRKQVERCYTVAKKYLRKVNIGNVYLLT
jgi:pyruvate formate lyase activating enzyme